MKKLIIVLPLLIAVFMVPSMAQSQQRFNEKRARGECGQGPGAGEHMGPYHGLCYGDPQHLKEELNLSSEQIKKVSDINEKFQRERENLFKAMRPGRDDLRRLLLADTINYDEVRKKLKEISDVEIELKILQIRHRIELQKILTPEQLEKLKGERRHMRHRRMHRNDD